jgi:tape measure domain-containing protein
MDALNKEMKEMSGDGGGVDTMQRKVKSTGMAFGALGTMIGGAAVLGGITSFGKAAYEAATNYEDLSIQLGVILGDAKQVPAVMAEWKKFSDVTPFEPEQVQKAGKQLLAFGIELDDVIPKMTMLGDISAGSGKDFNELVSIYGKALSKGKVQGEILDMLADATINIIPALAEAMGVADTEVAKLGSEGKISIEIFDKALASMTASGSTYGGMMDKLSQSTAGIMSTMKGAFQGLMKEVGTAFMPMIKELALAAIPAIENAIKNLQPYLAKLPQWFEEAKATALSIFEPLMRIYDALSRILAPIMEAGEGLGIFGNVMTSIMPRFDTIAWALDKLAVALEVVADAGAWVADTWNWAFGLAEDEVEGLSRNSKVYIKEMTSFAQKEFGASAQQVQVAFENSSPAKTHLVGTPRHS